MNLTNLKYFIAVAGLGSITEAAKEAYVSQSAVSKMIKQLEDEIGVQLFDREGRTIKLNQQGKLFYSYVSDSLNLLDRGIKAVQGSKNINQKPLNVLFTVASPLIAKIITRMQEVLPHVSLNIHQKNAFAKDLEQFDFIISTKPIPNFTSIPLITEEIMIAAKKGILPNQDFIEIKSLKNYPFIGLDQDTELQQTIDQFLLKENTKLNYQYQSDEPATVRQLITSGLGMGFVPAISWHSFEAQDIVTAHLLPTTPQRTIYLNSPQKILSDEQRLFSNEIAKVFVEEREKVQG
ncbi:MULTISPECIES: LysR family transcriptional regulator [Lactobacillus]|uniref:LysR family transcriptional regulator n=1 Tax=Lactobacillus xujianguonis TaxID=2495899 RepID=A0A437SVB4_9LACO|nr:MULTISPECIES: LysR family transcriptional regulator [Lactobacillus]RVU70777.1 LysR family transcriptional regulator [Lactobacillus xujianguonis]RVU73960.1 LysR family transcriptional regulator [Lactobacillus xujianguonis]